MSGREAGIDFRHRASIEDHQQFPKITLARKKSDDSDNFSVWREIRGSNERKASDY